MFHPTTRYLATFLLLGVTAGPAVAAGEIQAVVRTANPIVIDGDVSEIEWAGIEAQPLPWEIDPRRVAVTTWETSARITHDGTRLLVAIEAQDNEPDRVVASRGARDSVGNEDFVAVLIDAEGGRQRHFVFRVNAAGVLDDEIVGRGNNGSPEWSGTWEAVALRTDNGLLGGDVHSALHAQCQHPAGWRPAAGHQCRATHRPRPPRNPGHGAGGHHEMPATSASTR